MYEFNTCHLYIDTEHTVAQAPASHPLPPPMDGIVSCSDHLYMHKCSVYVRICQSQEVQELRLAHFLHVPLLYVGRIEDKRQTNCESFVRKSVAEKTLRRRWMGGGWTHQKPIGNAEFTSVTEQNVVVRNWMHNTYGGHSL